MAKTPRYVVLTVDYEIFGNGSGDVRQHAVEPVARMLDMCAPLEMPITVFFEMEEYTAFLQHSAALRRDLGYDPAELMARQVQELVVRGHDVQLHLHPEWYGAQYSAGQWTLNPATPAVDSLFAGQAETDRYIHDRKSGLEGIIRQVSPERAVRAFRAGAFCAQPGKRLLTALSTNGIVIDSSVVKGLRHRRGDVDLDYRNVPTGKRVWQVKDEVTREDSTGKVYELPIGSRMRRRIHQLGLSRLRAKFSKNVPRDRQKEMLTQLGVSRNPFSLLSLLCQPVPIKFDFHNMPPRKLLKWVKDTPSPQPSAPFDAVILIGHTKEHLSDDSFGHFINLLAHDQEIRVVTLDFLAGLLRPT